MVEVLCGLLADGPVATEILPMYTAPLEAQRRISHFFVALDIRRFVPPEVFAARLQRMVDALRALPATEEAVLVAGDPEKHLRREREIAGIPMRDERFAEFLALDPEFQRAVYA
jgi:LDH2 family malate/lactate/ureidoglycolate dehydrogenase